MDGTGLDGYCSIYQGHLLYQKDIYGCCRGAVLNSVPTPYASRAVVAFLAVVSHCRFFVVVRMRLDQGCAPFSSTPFQPLPVAATRGTLVRSRSP